MRCAGVVVLGGGAVGAGLGSAGSRCWGRAGGGRGVSGDTEHLTI